MNIVRSKMEEVNQAMAGAGSAGAAVSSGKLSAIFFACAATVSAILVMVFLEPQSKKEKALCFASTLIFAACASSAIKLYLGIDFPDTNDGRMANAGLTIASGMPGWVCVRALFLTLDKMEGKDIGQIIAIIKGWFK
jgi:hypothetical protein